MDGLDIEELALQCWQHLGGRDSDKEAIMNVARNVILFTRDYCADVVKQMPGDIFLIATDPRDLVAQTIQGIFKAAPAQEVVETPVADPGLAYPDDDDDEEYGAVAAL